MIPKQTKTNKMTAALLWFLYNLGPTNSFARISVEPLVSQNDLNHKDVCLKYTTHLYRDSEETPREAESPGQTDLSPFHQ